MINLQRSGAIAAFGCAAAFLIGFWLYFTLLIPAEYGSSRVDSLKHAAFLVEHRTTLYAWNLIIYVVFGFLQALVSLALYERMKAGAAALMQSATTCGLIWATLVIASGMVANIGAGVVVGLYDRDPAQAAAVWLTIATVVSGLGGGNEIVGGMWLLLVSVTALRTRGLPRWIGYFGAVVSMTGLATTVPPLKELGSIFGLGLIVWYVWLGCVLLITERRRAGEPTAS